MHLLLRVDADGKIGLGHFYRSTNLAKSLVENGHTVFFSFLTSGFWSQNINNGFEYPTLELIKGREEQQTIQFITKKNIDVFYVDGVIDFREEFIKEIKMKCKIVFYQNNSASRNLADIFILPSIHHDKSFFDVFSEKTRIFEGLEYFTFHPAIFKLKRKKGACKKVKNVAIIAGGSDPNDTLSIIYRLIHYNLFPETKFTFFFGNSYLFKNKIPFDLAPNIHFKLFNHQQILHNDVLIAAFGVSTYEFLFLGMPIISFGHQISNAIASDVLASKTNALISLGEIEKISKERLNKAIEVLIYDESIRKKLMYSAKNILDLKGIDRVINTIEDSL